MDRLKPGRLAEPLARMLASPLDQHRAATADGRFVEGELAAVYRRLEPLQALVHHFARNLAIHRRCGSAGARGVLEAERLRISDCVHQPQRLFELEVGFAGEADDEIAAERDVRPGRAEAVEETQVGVHAVCPVHGLENPVAAALYR